LKKYCQRNTKRHVKASGGEKEPIRFIKKECQGRKGVMWKGRVGRLEFFLKKKARNVARQRRPRSGGEVKC